jgi:hypothetical protein
MSTLRGVPSSVSSSIAFATAERITDAPLTGRAAMMSASSSVGSVSGRQNRMSVSNDMMMRRRSRGHLLQHGQGRALRVLQLRVHAAAGVEEQGHVERHSLVGAAREDRDGPRVSVFAHLESGLGKIGHHLPGRIRDGHGDVDEVELRLEDGRRRRAAARPRRRPPRRRTSVIAIAPARAFTAHPPKKRRTPSRTAVPRAAGGAEPLVSLLPQHEVGQHRAHGAAASGEAHHPAREARRVEAIVQGRGLEQLTAERLQRALRIAAERPVLAQGLRQHLPPSAARSRCPRP